MVIIILYTEKKYGITRIFVSHGYNTDTGETVILPNVSLDQALEQGWIELYMELGEYVLKEKKHEKR